MNWDFLLPEVLTGLAPFAFAFLHYLDPAYKAATPDVRKSVEVWGFVLYVVTMWLWFAFAFPFIVNAKSEAAMGATTLIIFIIMAILGILRVLLLGHITRTLTRHRAEDAEDATSSLSA